MVKNKDAFRALPIKERATLINKYVSGGIMDLEEMRRHYNSFGDGGDTSEDGINMYPIYDSQQKAKFAYDAGSRNPEAIGAAIPTRIGSDGTVEGGNIKSTMFTTAANNNGSSNTNFESKSTISYNDGLYNTIHVGNSNNNGVINSFEHHSFGMPNGDRYYTYNDNGVLSDRYEVNFAKRLGMDKLPKPKTLFENGGKLNIFDIGGNTTTPNKTKEQVATELQSKSRNEILSLQQTLADAGYYDQTLQLGKNDSAFGLQDFLIGKGLLTTNDRDGSIGENTIKALQTFLVNEKYLPRHTETGYDNIDGKLGNTTQDAYNAYLRKSNVDGFYGDKTLNAYYNYLNQNDNTIRPTNTSDLTEEEFFKYINTPIRQQTWQSNNFKGWSDDDLRYLYNKLATTGWDPKALMYAIDRETNFMPYAKNPNTSAIGLAQLTKAQLKQLYKDSYKDLSEEELTDKVNKAYNSYRDKTRSIKDIIDDTILQYSWMRNRVKTEPHNMGYGRIKVNLLAPNASLDSKIPKYVYEGSLTKAQQAKIKLGESTYRDLMMMYDEEFKNKFNL